MSRLHFAKFDIERMRMLYLGMKKQYYTYLEDNPYHYIQSEHSSILHVKECHYAKQIKKSGMVRIEGQALFEGYAICKHCSKDFSAIQFYPEPAICSDEFVNIAQSEFDENYINRLCQRYGLTCQISNGLIFIKSPIASWRIYHDYESVVEVFHQNMRTQKSSKARQRRPTNEGFHKQNIKEKRLEAVVKYIYYHDRNFFSGKRSRKSRMEQIFEQLENVRK